jgi:excisionase family DNA binding protein
MANNSDTEKYYTTKEAADILGLSIGTVQRIVERGLVKAFLTQGGHRRIWASSLNLYCIERGGFKLDTVTENPQIYILHSSQHIHNELAKIESRSGIKVITNPLDLMGLSNQVFGVFVDVRIPWLESSPDQFQSRMSLNVNIVAYNTHELPADSPWRQDPKVTLLDGDISADLIEGYFMAVFQQKTSRVKKPESMAISH